MFDPRASTFWQASLRSGLLDAESLNACWEAIEPAKRDVPEHVCRRLARQAVQAKLLTFWQAQQLLAGRSTGYRIDRYLLLDLIGQGGMGQVYLARDTRLDRPVALKILAPGRLTKPLAVARFEREAKAGAKLQHENLVRIYDFGEYEGRYYLVMEYIEGKTIAALISERGSIPQAAAVRLVRQVALGLDHAHRKGLIHRDVNPYNILVTLDGTAKLADLGLAITQSDVERVTRDGVTVGTFDYVAPEQALDSRAADARSDIYSLGCTLYHMLAARVPFPAPSLPEKLLGHQSVDPVPLFRLVPGIPRGLSEIVERMMTKRPDERYATSREVASALAHYEAGGAGAGSSDLNLPLLVPVGAGSAPRSGARAAAIRAETGAAAFFAGEGARTAGPASRPRAAVNASRDRHLADPTVPILTPDDDFNKGEDEVRLILDTDPEVLLSEIQSQQPQTRCSTDASPLPDAASGLVASRARFWIGGLVALAVMVAVLFGILASHRVGVP